MRMLAVVSLALLLSAPAAGEHTAAGPPSFLLVALPSLGSVTWRCGRTDGAFGLGYREFWSSATTFVTLRTRRRTVATKRVDPQELVTFPLLRTGAERLTFVQSTEPGTLRAVVSVRFAPHPGYFPCRSYLPPPFAVSVAFRSNAR